MVTQFNNTKRKKFFYPKGRIIAFNFFAYNSENSFSIQKATPRLTIDRLWCCGTILLDPKEI